MLRKRYYILFVARDDDGRIRKIPSAVALRLRICCRCAGGSVHHCRTGRFVYTDVVKDGKLQPGARGAGESAQGLQKQMAQIAHDFRDVASPFTGSACEQKSPRSIGLKQNRLVSSRAQGSGKRPLWRPPPVGIGLGDDPGSR